MVRRSARGRSRAWSTIRPSSPLGRQSSLLRTLFTMPRLHALERAAGIDARYDDHDDFGLGMGSHSQPDGGSSSYRGITPFGTPARPGNWFSFTRRLLPKAGGFHIRAKRAKGVFLFRRFRIYSSAHRNVPSPFFTIPAFLSHFHSGRRRLSHLAKVLQVLEGSGRRRWREGGIGLHERRGGRFCFSDLIFSPHTILFFTAESFRVLYARCNCTALAERQGSTVMALEQILPFHNMIS